MPSYFQDLALKRTGVSISATAIGTDPSDFPQNFPMAVWSMQLQKYTEYWREFTGEIWDETIPSSDSGDNSGKEALRFPLQLNPFKRACMKHSYVLFGEVPDTPGPLAPIRCSARRDPRTKKVDDAKQGTAKTIEQWVNQVWIDNYGRSLQQEAGLLLQFLGGCVFRYTWEPDNPDLESGIGIEPVIADFFLPIWHGSKPDKLLEAWVVYRMPAREAQLRFGWNGNGADPLYVEHWTINDGVTITLNNEPLSLEISGENFVFDHLPNPFGDIPFVYIPRERAGSFYGLSLLDDAIGLAKEINARVADMGDIVRESAHRATYGTNITGAPKVMDAGGTRPIINLGVTPPGGEAPAVFAIDPPTVASGAADYPEYLRKELNRELFTPDVTDGEDEGSQRSALTLAFRMLPTTWKARVARTNFATGLISFAKKLCYLGIAKGEAPFTLADLRGIDWGISWSPMIPRDSEAELNKVNIAYNADMLSPVTGMEILDQVDDPERELALVKEHREWQAQQAIQVKQSQAAMSSPAIKEATR